MIEYLPRSMQHSELYLTQFGMEDCPPGHYYGPAVRDHYLLHYIVDGQGIFKVGGRTYTLSKGQGFLIYPDTVTYYEADSVSPWSYCWIGFNGLITENLLKRAGFSDDAPIFSYHKDDAIQASIQSMVESIRLHKAKHVSLTGKLYLLIAALIENSPVNELPGMNSRTQHYTDQVIRFIEMNYANKITVSDIARNIGLNRSYLNTLFREMMNLSIQDYLIRYRIQRACELMTNDQLTIGDISRSVGYNDPLLFSKVFKKHKGLPPSEYRRQSASDTV